MKVNLQMARIIMEAFIVPDTAAPQLLFLSQKKSQKALC